MRSVGNILSGMFQPFVAYARDAGTISRKKSLKGIGKLAEKMPAIIAYGGSAYVTALITGFPSEFGWLKAVLQLLIKTFGG